MWVSEEFPCRKAPGQAAQGAAGTPTPEGVSGMCGCGTKGRGLVVDPYCQVLVGLEAF